MAGNFWKSLGVGNTFDQIDQSLGGVASFVKNVGQKINDLPVNQFMANHPVLGSIYSGMQGASNMATGGLQGAANQALDPTGTQGLEQLQAQHPIATGIGQGAGMALGLAATPVAAPAEAGTAAAKILPTIGRNVLTAAAAAAPGTVAEGVQTRDWGSALTHGLENTAIGGAMGVGAEKGAQALTPMLNKIQAKAMGLSTKDIKQSLAGLAKKQGTNVAGTQAAGGAGLIQNVVDLGNKFGAYFQKGKEGLWNYIKDGYGKLNDLYNSAAPAITNALPQIAQRGDLAQARQIFGDAAVNKELLDQAGKIGKMKWTDARIYTGDMMSAAHKELLPDAEIKMKGAVAEALHNHLGETAQGLSQVAQQAGQDVPNLHDLDAVYGAAKAIHGAQSREAVGLPATYSPGSDTAARAGVTNMIMHGLGGLEGGVASLIGGFDPDDPSSYLKTGLGIASGTVLGRMANRGASKLAELTSGLSARGMAGGLNAAQGMAPQMAQIGARLPQALGQAAGGQPPDIGTPETTTPGTTPADQTTQVPTVPIPNAPSQPQMAGTNWQTGPGVPTQAEAPKLPPEHAEAVTQATNKEQELTSQQVTAARQSISPQFMDMIHQKILNDYQNWQSPYKPDFDTFQSQIMSSTNNLDPKNINTAKIIGGPNYKDYLKSYNVALNLQSLGKDLVSAINYSPAYHPLGFTGTEEKEKHDELVHTLYTAMTGDMKDPDKATQKSIENTLFSLRRLGSNNAKTKALYNILEKEYGIRFDMLKQYGLTQ